MEVEWSGEMIEDFTTKIDYSIIEEVLSELPEYIDI